MSATARVPDTVNAVTGTPTTIDGRASTGATTYLWEALEPNHGITLTNTDEPVATCTTTDPGEYVVRLTVSDQTAASSAALTIVKSTARQVVIDGPTEGQVASAIVLDASRSQVPDEANFTWTATTTGDLQPRTKPDGATFTLYPLSSGPHTVQVRVSPAGDPTRAVTASTTITISERANDAAAGPDEMYWQKQMLSDVRAAPATLKAAATTWQGYTATLLGLFSTVALVAGPKTITDIAYPIVGWIALACVGLAFLAAFYGLYLLATVTATGPRFGPGVDALAYQQATIKAVEDGNATFTRSKTFTMGAAVLIAIGSLAVTVAAFVPPASKVNVLVRTNTRTLCGTLTTDATGAVKINNTPLNEKAESTTVVDSCGN